MSSLPDPIDNAKRIAALRDWFRNTFCDAIADGLTDDEVLHYGALWGALILHWRRGDFDHSVESTEMIGGAR